MAIIGWQGVVSALVVLLAAALHYHITTAAIEEQWLAPAATVDDVEETRCNIERVDAAELTRSDFDARFWHKQPVLITGLAASWPAMNGAWSRRAFMARFGERLVASSPAQLFATFDTDSHEKRRLADLLRLMRDGSEIAVFDGELLGRNRAMRADLDLDNAIQAAPERGEGASWKRGERRPLPFYLSPAHGGSQYPALTISGDSHGIPFHTHGDGWLAVVAGRKRWFMWAHEDMPSEVAHAFNPLNTTTHDWARAPGPGGYRALRAARPEALRECVQESGDIMYVPEGWYHATLNVGETLAVGGQEQWPKERRLAAARAAFERGGGAARAGLEAHKRLGIAQHQAPELARSAEGPSAAALFQKAIEMAPVSDLSLYVWLSKAERDATAGAQALRSGLAALRVMQRAGDISPHAARLVYVEFGRRAALTGEDAIARDALSAAFELGTRDFDDVNNLLASLMVAGHDGEACAVLRQALSDTPNEVRLRAVARKLSKQCGSV